MVEPRSCTTEHFNPSLFSSTIPLYARLAQIVISLTPLIHSLIKSPSYRHHNIYSPTTFGTLSKDLKTSLPHPLFVCGLVINSFPLSDRSHRGENTKSDVIRTRRGAIEARAHKTGLSDRLFGEEGTITIASEEARCAE